MTVDKNKLKLKVSISSGSGFCAGVVKAVRMTEKLLEDGEEVFCVGKIVHNAEEIKRLSRKGLHTITLSEIPLLHNKTILFRAHGEPPSSYLLAQQNGNTLIDATCSVVLSIQRKVRKALEDGEKVVIFGTKGHPEVVGLAGQGQERILVVGSLEEAAVIDFPPEITLFSQTTRSLEEFRILSSFLEKRGIRVKAYDTVCRQVHNREAALRRYAAEQDVLIFVAGMDSSNGKVLYSVCKSANPNSYYVSDYFMIMPDWFSQGQKVGIAGATSTPWWLMEHIKEHLEQL